MSKAKMVPGQSKWEVLEEGQGVVIQVEHNCLSDSSIAFNVHYEDNEYALVLAAEDYRSAKALASALRRVSWVEAKVKEVAHAARS